MPIYLNWTLTIFGVIACIGLAIFAERRANRPADPLRPRMIPWRLVIVVAGFTVLLLFINILNLSGIETGPDKSILGRGRLG